MGVWGLRPQWGQGAKPFAFPDMFTELQVTTNYSFLRGASHPEELFAAAALLGYNALAVTDRNTLAGIARAHQRASS